MMRNEPLQPVMVEEPIRLTKEGHKFVHQCVDSRMLGRDLPLSVASGIMARVGMHFGYLKYSFAALSSTILGTFILSRAFSYRSCFQKVIQQPGNTLAERIPQNKRIIQNQLTGRSPDSSQPADPEYAQPNYLNVDIDKPDYPGMDPSVPDLTIDEEMPPPRPGQTYADLRRQNREAYQQRLRAPRPSGPPTSPEQPPTSSLPDGLFSSSPYESSSYSFDSSVGSYDRAGTYQTPPTEKSPSHDRIPPRRIRTNKYGDVLEE